MRMKRVEIRQLHIIAKLTGQISVTVAWYRHVIAFELGFCKWKRLVCIDCVVVRNAWAVTQLLSRPQHSYRPEQRENETLVESENLANLTFSLLVIILWVLHDFIHKAMATARNPMEQRRHLLVSENVDEYSALLKYAVITV